MKKRMFILLFTAGLMLVMIVVLNAFAEKSEDQLLGTTDHLAYTLIKEPSSEGEEGEAAVKAANTDISGEIVIPSDFTDDTSGKKYKVTRIAYRGFTDRKNITSVSIPDSVISIGKYAFAGCENITSINIPDNVTSIEEYAFGSCKNIKNIKIPNGITEIKKGVYEGCESLTSVSIPDGVTSIGEKAFEGCVKITSINIPNTVTSIGKDAFYGCEGITKIKIPAGVTEIVGGAFWNCTNLETVDFEKDSQLKSIGNSAFTDCYKLKNIKIPDKTESIGATAFASCNSLETIEIPASVTSIGDDAFSSCKNLANVTFAKDTEIKKIGKSTFQRTALTNIEVPATVESIGESAFDACSQLKKVTLNNKLTEIGAYAFNNCKNLEDINLDISSLKTIGDSAFNACKKLKNVKLSGSIKSIGKNAFSYCENLENIELGRLLESIGDEAFKKCTKIKKIHIPQNTNQNFGKGVFSGCTSLEEVYYPVGIDITESGIQEEATRIQYNEERQGTVSIVKVDIKDYLYSLDIEERIFGMKVVEIKENCFDNVKYKYPSRIRIPMYVEKIGDSCLLNLRGLVELSYPESLNIEKTGVSEETIKIAYAIEDENVIIKQIILWNIPVDLKIPESICGRPVVKIGENVLKMDGDYGKTIMDFIKVTLDVFMSKIGIALFNVLDAINALADMANNMEEQQKLLIALTSLSISDNVVEIGANAFSNNQGLTKLIFTGNSKLNSIRDNAFQDCNGLKSVELPPLLSTLGKNVFHGCQNLKEVYLPMKFSDESISISGLVTKVYYSVNNNEVIIEKIVLGAGVSKIVLPQTICGLRVAGVSKNVDPSIYTFGTALFKVEESINPDIHTFGSILSGSKQDSNNNATIAESNVEKEEIGSSKKEETADSSDLNNYKLYIVTIIFLALVAQFLGIKRFRK